MRRGHQFLTYAYVPPAAGFRDLHSFAFLGGSGRIGTATDTLLANVPVGPAQQLDMFLHAYDLCKAGRMEVRVLEGP